MSVGIERLTGYIPSYALSLKDLALARNVPPEKMTAGLGVHEMAIAAPCEDVVTLAAPHHFAAVGAWYDDFRQVDDEEVERMLSAAAGSTG